MVTLLVVHCFHFTDFSVIVIIAATATIDDEGVDRDQLVRVTMFEKCSDLFRAEHQLPLPVAE